jgi:hypothetical protein
MAVIDSKFSLFDNGGDLIPGDIVVGLRGGINTKFNNTGGVGTFLPLLGGTMLGAIDMGGFKITNLATPTDPADAVTKTYADSTFAHLGANTDITSLGGLTGIISQPTFIQSSTGLPVLAFGYAGGATDYLGIGNGTANGAILRVLSSNTNASFSVLSKGSGGVFIGSETVTTAPLVIQSNGHTFTFSVPTWTGNRTLTFPDANVTLVSGTMLTNALTSAHIFVGNVSNVATDVAMSGDATLANTGAITVASIGGKAVSLGGSFTMSGAFTFTGTITGNTGVTFPTSGTLATTTGSLASITADSGSATVSGGTITLTGASTGLTTSGSGSTVSLAGLLNATFGGTGVSVPTAHGIMVAEGASAMTPIVLSSGQILIGSTGADPVAAAINSGTGILVANGAGSITVNLAAIASHDILSNITGGSAAPIANTLTATIDAAIGSTQGNILYRNSSAWVVLAPGSSGQLLATGGAAANPAWTTATFPGTVGTTGTILRSDGTNWVASTATFANTYTASNLLYSNGSNTVTGLATANSSVLVTSSSGVPSLSTTLPSGIAATNMALTTPTIKGSNGFNIATFSDVASATDYFTFTAGIANAAAMTIVSSNTNASFSLIGKGSGGVAINPGVTSAQPFALYYGSFNVGFNVASITNNRTLTLADGNTILVAGTMAPTVSPSFTTPSLGVATATSINGLAFTSTSAATLTIGSSKTVSFANNATFADTVSLASTLTLAGPFTTSGVFASTFTMTGTTTVTFPTSGTLATVGGNLGNATATSLTFSPTTNGIVGTTTNDNAPTGTVGEFVSSEVAPNTVALSNAVIANVTSISLTAGDWDLFGCVSFTATGAVVETTIIAGISPTSAAVDGNFCQGALYQLVLSFTTGGNQLLGGLNRRISIATTTTIYLIADAAFSAGTSLKAGGFIGARRRR